MIQSMERLIIGLNAKTNKEKQKDVYVMPDPSYPSEHKRVTIIIGGQQYTSASFISLNDMIMLTEYLTSGADNYRHEVANLIRSKIICEGSQRPAVDQIAAQDNDLFALYINSLLEEDDKLRSSYDKFAEEEDICYRLILSVDDESKEFKKSLAASFQKIKIPELYTEEVQNNLLSFAAALKVALEPYSVISDTLIEWAKRFGDQLKSVLSDIHIPTFSKEKKDKFSELYQQWGDYGWTCIPHTSLSYFDQSPQNQKSADKAALALCNASKMEELFSILRSKSILKSDLEEAIFDFQHKKYKSCSMIIFSMIDSMLICLQRDEDRNPRTKMRYSGAIAAEKLLQHIKDEQNIGQMFFRLLAYVNLSACIQKVFKNGDDFKYQPTVINRNFIDHGMLTRCVVQKDCVQLFLLFYNLIEVVDIIDD